MKRISFGQQDPRNTKGRPQRSTRWVPNPEKSGVISKFIIGEKRPGLDQRQDFDPLLKTRLNAAKAELKDAPLLEQLRKEKEDAGEKPESFEKIWKSFASKILVKDLGKIPFFEEADTEHKRIIRDLREAYKVRGQLGLDGRIKYAFYGHLTGARFTNSDIKNQQALADLRYPSEWFPATRSTHRTIYLHVGPTNSGKTYHALQRLEQAESGVYAGPLRLLAHEVYTRMNAKGKPCSLVTGEERRLADPENNSAGSLSACTVEMMPLNKSLDVAVIDEIQMIGSSDRGWAWTQALLGVKAKEVHLCGEERTVPLIREICASLGEKLVIKRYERLSPLKVADSSLEGGLKNLKKGDCIVSFSVMGIHALRKQIERATGRKVATVYGSLPPETRAQQARLFNEPNNEYDFLVASDAVGMGLNLAIKRIIFETSSKYDGVSRKQLNVADIKQIAGRAGRYRIANFQKTADADPTEKAREDMASQDLATGVKGEVADIPAPSTPLVSEDNENVGLVTTLEAFDFPIIRAAMSSEPEPIRSAGIFPPSPVLERFASYFPPSTPFSYILTRLHELSQMHQRFHLCGLKDQVWIADIIEPVQGLTIGDRNVICSAPASQTDAELWRNLMPAYARCIADQTGGALYELEHLPLEVLELEVSANREYLRSLERLHKGIVTYLWLSYRFAGIFSTRSLAFHVKGLVEAKIEDVLGKFSFSEAERRKKAAQREKQMLRGMSEVMEGEDVADHVAETTAAHPLEEGEAGEEFDKVNAQPELEIDLEGGERRSQQQLDEQTSLTFGGDRFGGEEEMVVEDPMEAEQIVEEDGSSASSFSQWREQETREESQATKEQDLGTTISDGEEKGHAAARTDDLFSIEETQRPSVGQKLTQEAGTHRATPATSSELYSGDFETPVTPDTELSDEEPPLSTQEAPPTSVPDEDVAPQSWQTEERPAGHSQSGGVPPKHLAHLDVDATELERDVSSRP